ncbi:TraM recognition site of TraD and TraG [Micromonospora sediminicola]|uniref:TraM recognition site of TraD and TraG n=1 Tax=Micromonospora sediminicola TaxID=946078 RepID=A0A1A9B271_9ACTN|nr:TraM recognition domain-containing protein [Micromonospora sediminicola]SBT63112.1 TraM recognition site of TraD and TraG [Micromonospora sediminicola]SBT63124.1 TraM recognition site of TraD and TraG [Micromonospora sediminicola]
MSKDRTFPGSALGIGLLVDAAGVAAIQLPLPYADLAGGGALVTGTTVAGVALVTWVGARRGTAGQLDRWSRRSRRDGGVASLRDHLRTTSAWSMRRRAVVLKPSLAHANMWERWRTPVSEYAAEIGKTGRRRLWISAEDNILRVAGPRSGKTTAMAGRIIKAPGGVVVTSTRVDLLKTLPMRAAKGPCHIYDPGGISKAGSTIKWSPLTGCRSTAIAAKRAAAMLPESGSDEGERWDKQARRVLAVLMHAAALTDRPMRQVQAWLDVDGPALRVAATEVEQALEDSPSASAQRAAARQFYGTVDKTRSSIVTTAMVALQWLTDDKAAAIGDCEPSESMDLDDLLDRRGTIYILGSKEGLTAPLTGALVAEVIRLAEIVAEQRGGRLDPCLTLVLDEAAKVAPGPLHEWAADCGGRGIVLDVAVHSLAAMEHTWGDHAARMILSTCNAILVGAGCKDPHDLAHWEALSGERKEISETRDKDGEVTSTTEIGRPVITAAQIAQLPKGMAIVYGLGPVSIVKTPNTWKWRSVRKALAQAARQMPQQTRYEEQMAAEDRVTEPAQ